MSATRAEHGDYQTYKRINQRAQEILRRYSTGDLTSDQIFEAFSALLDPLQKPHRNQDFIPSRYTTFEDIFVGDGSVKPEFDVLRYLYRDSWVETLGDLEYLTREQVLDVQMIGPGRFAKILDILDAAGVELGSKQGEIDTSYWIHHDTWGPFPRQRAYDSALTKLCKPITKDVDRLASIGIKTLGDWMNASEEQIYIGLYEHDFNLALAAHEDDAGWFSKNPMPAWAYEQTSDTRYLIRRVKRHLTQSIPDLYHLPGLLGGGLAQLFRERPIPAS